MIHVLLITGRVHLWNECLGAIRRFVMDVLQKDKGDQLWMFISAHGDTDFSDGDPSNIRGLIEEIKPMSVHLRKYVLDPPEPHPMYQHKWDSVNSCLRYCSMFYHNWKAFEMLEQAMAEKGVVAADIGWVIKMRADFMPLEPWQLPCVPVPNMLYVPGSDHHYNWEIPNWIPDQVGAGSFHTMKAYCNVYANREKFFQEHGIKIHIPEEVLKSHMDQHGVTWCKARCEYTISNKRFDVDDYAGNKDVKHARFGV